MPKEFSGLVCIGFLCGIVVGFLIVSLQQHPIRRQFWVPFGFALLLGAYLLIAIEAAGWWVGFMAGLSLIAGGVGSGLGVIGRGSLIVSTLWIFPLMELNRLLPAVPFVMAAVCGIMFAATLWLCRRPVGETLGEWVLRLMYRMRVVGPGVASMPRTGPLLVIANHTAYLDPCWVMIPLPRDLTPIMYGDYFKKFGLHFYMKHIINAIPSGVGSVRREAPELDEVVRRLDRGEGILVFPEGWVRRKEEESIRRFAQGPWRILRDRPATPVVACWIEGGWGSWSSFWNGPPFKGKRIDVRRPINVGVSTPVVLDAETLADQHRTRELLKQMVLDARAHLAACGLAPVNPVAKPQAAQITESPASPP
jgi:1-acyl-sn-glycerol-3-phosphate acyltransferase